MFGGNGGNGNISFLQLWANEKAGPDGGDGGNGGHVILEASYDVNSFNHVTSILRAEEGENGASKDCHGANAKHTVIRVPVGTIIKNEENKIIGDLDKEKLMFVAARGGSGGKGNRFFATDTEQSPKICEYGAEGEDVSYMLELRSMADIGFIGFPNAGKSTLLRAISRAKPKVASYAFTTLKPHLGIIPYDDYENLTVADLPGLIEDSHKNKGLGIQFLKHAERCSVLLFVLDVSYQNTWDHFDSLLFELENFSPQLAARPKIIAANKIDLEDGETNAKELQKRMEERDILVIPISAKMGTNLQKLLIEMRRFVDDFKKNNVSEE